MCPLTSCKLTSQMYIYESHTIRISRASSQIVVPLHVPQHVNQCYPRDILNLWHLFSDITIGFGRTGYPLHFVSSLGCIERNSVFIFFLSFFLSFFMYIRVSTTDPLPLHTSPHLGGYFGLKNWSKSLAVFLSDIKTLFKH